jgi:hypothetical protein
MAHDLQMSTPAGPAATAAAAPTAEPEPGTAGMELSSPAGRAFFVRRVTAVRDFQLFFVSSVATILLVRAILAATGWPQLGGGKIHFAHLMWGGVGMLIAFILFMAMQGRLWNQLATLSAGIGFGLFLDELGKFITSDNDYFFQPTVAIIYVVFVVLFFLFRWLGKVDTISPQAALVNAFDLAKEAVLRDMDTAEKDEALWLLRRSNAASPVTRSLSEMLDTMEPSAKTSTNPLLNPKQTLRRLYDGIIRRRWFKRIVIGWFIFTSVVALIAPLVGDDSPSELTFGQAGALISGVITGVLVTVGIVRWRRSKLQAFRWFERGALVSILIGGFFSFYQNQVAAVFGLLWLLLTLAVIQSMVGAELARAAAEAQTQTAGG